MLCAKAKSLGKKTEGTVAGIFLACARVTILLLDIYRNLNFRGPLSPVFMRVSRSGLGGNGTRPFGPNLSQKMSIFSLQNLGINATIKNS